MDHKIRILIETNASGAAADLRGVAAAASAAGKAVAGVGPDAKASSSALSSVGASAKGAGSAVEAAGRQAVGGLGGTVQAADAAGASMGKLRGFAQEAAASFTGFVSAQAVIGGIKQAFAFATDAVLGFDDAMTQSTAIMGDVSAAQKAAMGETAKQVAVDYNQSLEDVAKGYYFLVSAGYDAATSQKLIGQATAFAKAGMMDLEQATELAADAQTAMGLKTGDVSEDVKQFARVTDVLAQANNEASGSVLDFAQALTNKAATAAVGYKVSLEQTVAVLEAFATKGVKGLKAGEAFAIVLRDLGEKSAKNKDEFAAMGITMYDAQGAFVGFPTIIGQFEKALQGQSVEAVNAKLATLGMTAEGMNYVKMLMGSSEALAKYEAGLKNAGGAAQTVAEKQMQSFVEQLKHLNSVASVAAVNGFGKLADALGWLRDEFSGTIANVTRLGASLIETLTPIGKAIAGIGAAGVIAALKAVATAFDAITGVAAQFSTVIAGAALAGAVHLAATMIGPVVAGFRAATAATLDFIKVQVADRFMAAITAADLFASTLMQTGSAAKAAAAASGELKVALSGLNAVPLIALGTAALAAVQYFKDVDQASQDMIATITKKIDMNSTKSIGAGIEELHGKSRALNADLATYPGFWQQFGSSMADVVVPFHDVENSAVETASAIGDVNIQAMKLSDRANQLSLHLMEMARPFSPLSEGLDRTKNKFADFTAEGLKAGAQTQRVADAMVRLATENHLDLALEEDRKAVVKLFEATQQSAPAQAFAQSMSVMGNAASSAKEQVDAYKGALDGLAGVHISTQQAENTFAASLDAVREKLGPNVNLLDAYSASNRAARETVLSSAAGAMAHAVTVFQETNSLAQANFVLGIHREQLVNSMVQTGMTRQAAEGYIATLNLTPEKIQTLAELEKTQAEAHAAGLQGQLDKIGQGANANVTANTGSAIANVQALNNALDEYVRKAANMPNSPGSGMGAAMGADSVRPRADGAVTWHQYAHGGIAAAQAFANGSEQHVAQVAPAGAWRVWAEPETGGEAYIPLSMAKAGRSIAITEAVAGHFGYQLVPKTAQQYANGWGMPVARQFPQMPVATVSQGGSNSGVVVSPGAVQVNVRTDAQVDAAAFEQAVRNAVHPAIADMTRTLQTEVRSRRR